MMQYIAKKECDSLLAFLGEESLQACRKRGVQQSPIGVSWVGRHIVTIEVYKEQLLVRMTAVLPGSCEDAVEKRIQDTAMRESGDYHFSTRNLFGFSLAEITAYGVSLNQPLVLRQEIEAMGSRLDEICLSDE